MKKIISLGAFLILLISYSCHLQKPALHTSSYTLPHELGRGQGVSGAVAGIVNGQLMVVGGCNFPDQPAAEGGKKVFYSEVFVGEFRSEAIHWTRWGNLPEPRAYAAYCSWNNALVIAGGENASGALASVYLLRPHQVRPEMLPNLPQPRTGMACALLGDRFYLIGGVEAGKPTNTVLSIDLRQPYTGWRRETPYPRPLRSKLTATASADGGGIDLMLSFSGAERSDAVATAQGFYHLDTVQRVWVSVPLAPQMPQQGICFGGGMAVTHTERGALFFGGVNAHRFTPALQRIRRIAEAREQGDQVTLKALQKEVNTYLLAPISWHGFNTTLWSYWAGYGWRQIAQAESLGRADACALLYRQGILIVGGEVKPGIRSNKIDYLSIH